ncbi:MAG: hypothetical protein HY360_15620 [Verrucomicrobia bacterium]|nr:hypothetical protein [Verrucomicrobiota bacterium]
MKTQAKGCLIITAAVLGIVVLFGVVQTLRFPKQQERARKTWKEAALPEIRRLASDPNWVSAEIEMLNGMRPGMGILAEHWLTENMILMLDGEWLVYKSHCNKVPPHDVRDIFLAKGSNGKWYYSTCHFCVGMCVLLMEQQDVPPLDLETFIRVYHLKEFDGVSDECLQQTQIGPSAGRVPTRTYVAGIKPGLPDLSPLSRVAAAAISIATNSDPNLAGHGLKLCAVRYEHRYLPSAHPTGTTYVAIYYDDKLSGGDATGIDIEVRNKVAHLKTQKGKPLWSCKLDGEPRVRDDLLRQIVLGAITNFWPKIESKRLTLDEIVCCAPLGENKYAVSFRIAYPFVGQKTPSPNIKIEVYVTADGTVAEKNVSWNTR